MEQIIFLLKIISGLMVIGIAAIVACLWEIKEKIDWQNRFLYWDEELDNIGDNQK